MTTAYGEVQKYLRDVVFEFDSDECLLWPYAQNGFGYGQVFSEGNYHGIHRLVCKKFHGEPPSPKHEAAHNCGKSLCCNYRHIRWATTLENEQDKVIHGTLQQGEKISNVKLTEKDVLEIVSLKGAVTYRALGKRFGIGSSSVSMIMNGQSWGWLTGIAA